MKFAFESTAFVFPGQGSQAVGMGKELAQKYPAAMRTFEEADALLGIRLSTIMWEGPLEQLNDTINTQPALYVHSVAALRVLSGEFPDLRPAWVAGHSLGELSALTAAGSLPFAEGLVLVRTRGQLMKRAGQISPGGMAAVLGLEIPALEQVCKQASTAEEIVEVANDNCPGQVVISGAQRAVERAILGAKTAGAKRVIPLPVSIAAHSPLMKSVQVEFDQAVRATPIQEAEIPVISNVRAEPIASADHLREDLTAQLTSRVRWTESIRYLIRQGAHTFLEVGSGSVLTGLIHRIDPSAEGIPLGIPKDFEALNGEKAQ